MIEVKRWVALAGLVLGLAGVGSAVAASGGKDLLADRHKAKSVECAACHAEAPPAKPVPTAKCQACHGDFKAIAKKTEHTEPNPHQSHNGDTDCAQCHHVHKASEDLCAKCHVTNWTVP